jgi:hypothetical protein
VQYEIIVVTPRGEYKLLDMRGSRPNDSAFKLSLMTANVRTIAPNLASAKQYRDDFLTWCQACGPADVKRVILRKYLPPSTEGGKP